MLSRGIPRDVHQMVTFYEFVSTFRDFHKDVPVTLSQDDITMTYKKTTRLPSIILPIHESATPDLRLRGHDARQQNVLRRSFGHQDGTCAGSVN